MIWQEHYTNCQFGVFVPEDYKPSSMIGTVMLTVNDIPCGRMMFKTKIVSQPQKLYAKIESKAFQKIFISYSHKDESTVKFFAKAFQAQGVDYFFDRHYLRQAMSIRRRLKNTSTQPTSSSSVGQRMQQRATTFSWSASKLLPLPFHRKTWSRQPSPFTQ